MDVFKLIAVVLSLAFWCVWLVLRFREIEGHPVRNLLDGFSRLGGLTKLLLLLAVIRLVMFAGAKHGGTNDTDGAEGTNGVQSVLMMPVGLHLPPSTGGSIADETDFARGYRLESVLTNSAVSYALPSDATVGGCWHLRGAYEDVLRLDLGDFRFPLKDEELDSLWVHTWGFVRPHLASASNDIQVIGAPMSAVSGVSRFWSLAGEDAYLLTWEDFVVGRHSVANAQPAESVSAQLELHASGDFIARSNEVEWVYRRVIRPNPISPDNPEDPLWPGMPIHPYGPVQNLSVIEETNAYCWVDIVVQRADAWVRFTGDGPSNLADPSFAARAGETNRVLILIGKGYRVTCDMPFSVIAKSDGEIEEEWEDANTLRLRWSVYIGARGDGEPPLLLGAGLGSHRQSGFTMIVRPDRLGGEFIWTNFCCSVSGRGYHFACACNDECHCGGCHPAGYLRYEGYCLPAWGGYCGCSGGSEGTDPREEDPEDQERVGTSVTFSKKVLFLEDEYANTPDDVVPWYSETVSLGCTAWGGINGGHVKFEISGDSNLIQLGGRPLPLELDVAPGERVNVTNVYKAVSESSRYEEIEATATFTENETDWSETVTARATAVRVEVEPRIRREGAKNRHLLGVREGLFIRIFPDVGEINELDDDWRCLSTGQYQCPLQACYGGLQVCVNGCIYTPDLRIIEPTGIICRRGWTLSYDNHTNEAGWIGMRLDLTVQPESVCFNGLAMVEEATDEGFSEGYFGNHQFPASHDEGQGAGTWYNISDDNFFFYDCPRVEEECPPPWTAGTAVWLIPIAWGERDTANMVGKIGNVPGNYTQVFTIDPNGGVRIDKFSQWVMRMPNDLINHSADIILVQ